MESETSNFPCKDEEGVTEETPQRESHYPATQNANRNVWKLNASTVKQIIDKVRKVSRLKKKTERVGPMVIVNQKTQARQEKAAIKHVNDLVSLLCKETCGKVEKAKPEDAFRLFFENVNSLGMFATGEARGRKLRQIR